MAKPRPSMSRRDISKGTTKTISISSASNALQKSILIKSSDNKKIHFNYKLHEKYVNGKGRKNGESEERMIHLGKAIMGVKYANRGIYHLKGDNPPQVVYFHSFSKRKNIVVFVEEKTNVVRGFIPVKDINAWKRNLESRKR